MAGYINSSFSITPNTKYFFIKTVENEAYFGTCHISFSTPFENHRS